MDWKNPDYAEIFNRRAGMLRWLREHPHELPQLKAYYRANPADFISDWGVTYDPRNADIGRPTLIPFVLFDRQREWVDAVMNAWRTRTPLLTEKSRDGGYSWLLMALSCTICMFEEGVAIGVGSRKSEYVDKVGTMKPLLPKGRMFMENLPEEFRGDWVAWRDAPTMRITFPATGSLIGGEGGDDIGRGDRTSIYFVDEAQPLDAKIMTPSGWRLMADMQPNCEVMGPDGVRRKVTHVKDCGVHDVFRISFSDGTSTECSPNHFWQVETVLGKRKTLTLRTHELVDTFRYESPGGQTQYCYRIPVCQPVQFEPGLPLPLDPYLLGALLGDGSVKGGTIRITSADSEIVQAFRRLLPEGVVIGAFDGRYSHNIVDALGRRGRGSSGEYIRSRARVLIATAGIAGQGAHKKRIPEIYRRASPQARLSVLQGLMDTDGSATGGAASFYTTSHQLAEDVRFIVQSLGGTATHNIKPDRRGYKDVHAVHVTLPNGMEPFRLRRKLAALKPRKHPPGRTIVGIERVGRRPVRCITVDAADGLYLTDSFIVTHNSAHLEHPELVDASLSQTTNCRIDVSSVKGMNNSFARKRHEGKIPVFIFDYREDPRKDQAWYDKQCQELDPVVVAQEIDRDYQASVTGVVIPAAWARSAINALEVLGIAPTGDKLLALDVADEGLDKNAAIGRQGVEIVYAEEWSGKGSDTFYTVERTFEICDEYGFPRFRYDSDGLGALVRGDARVINERRGLVRARAIAAEGFRGSEGVLDPDGIVEGTIGIEGDKGRTNQDYFANRKAQQWWGLRRKFQRTHRWVTAVLAKDPAAIEKARCNPDLIISLNPKLPLLMKIVAELSQPTYATNGVGKIVVNKKPDKMKSPNLGDGVMIVAADGEAQPMIVTQAMLQQIRAAPRRRVGRRY